jgi:S1-C subfamily serine protease
MRAAASLLALAFALASTSAQALEPEALFAKVSPSVWTVRTVDAQERPLRGGSAVVVGPGRLVTSCHVLARASGLVVRRENVSYEAVLEFPDVERDLCQIKVANFREPPVALAPAGTARVGQRVYAIGSPRGLENTLSEGLLSGLRGGEDGRLLQTTAALSPGSSGGGLFDSEGRLLGITTFGAREPGSLNFAVPAEFLAEIPDRAQAALAQQKTRSSGSGRGLLAPLRAGDVLEYVRTDRLTGNKSSVTYRLDRITGDELFFNMGGRVEKADGQLVSVTSPVGGMFDSSSPPGGWGRKDVRPGMRWQADYVASTGDKWRHELEAAVTGEQSMRVDGVDLKVVQIAYTGWIYASYGTGASAVGTRFAGTAWYSNELRRVVRFEAEHRRGNASSTNEAIELVRVLR